MFENLNQPSPKRNKLDQKIGHAIFQRIKTLTKQQLTNIDTTALLQWMETATKTQIEEKLKVLQTELMEFYEKEESGSQTNSDKENKLRGEIKILDDQLLKLK